jgi:hypothetical protein
MITLPLTRMIYIQISERNRARALLLMLGGGFAVICLAGKIYGVGESHISFLKRKHIPFKKLKPSHIRLPETQRLVNR